MIIAVLMALAALLGVLYLGEIILFLLPLRSEGKPGKLPLVSVLIATKNEENVIEKTLRALKKSNYPKMEIIVVDSSTDRTAKLARKYAKVVLDKSGSGKPHALNMALRKARGKLLYIIDSDSVVEKDTLRKLVLNLGRDDAIVGVNLPDNRSNMVTYFGRLELAFLNCVDRVINRIMKITIIPGRNYVISKSALKRIGGFQNVLTEDVNISWRLYKSGRKIGVTRALCREQVPTRLRWYFKQQERWYAGSLREIKTVLQKLTLKEKFFYLPLVIVMVMLPHLLAGAVVLYLMTLQTTFLFLIGTAYAMLLLAAVRYLSLVDMVLSPVVVLLYSFFQVFLFGASFFRKKNLKWYKTPKEKLRAK